MDQRTLAPGILPRDYETDRSLAPFSSGTSKGEPHAHEIGNFDFQRFALCPRPRQSSYPLISVFHKLWFHLCPFVVD